ncbi:hypothetical protein [Paenibacillus tuaregi]|uniref:hypothetical protein n=1 Tax=Paenibacillus tuaregi TaxID=1816681 RepID=UPI000837D085|nr:hypothetical protein [Paenibacillus tuaregi]
MDNHNISGPGLPEGKLKHSGPGIASFIVSIVALFAYVAAIFIIVVTAHDLLNAAKSVPTETIVNHPGVVQAGVTILAAMALTLVSVILGIIGLTLANRKRLFAILGVCIGALPPALMLVLFLIRTS